MLIDLPMTDAEVKEGRHDDNGPGRNGREDHGRSEGQLRTLGLTFETLT